MTDPPVTVDVMQHAKPGCEPQYEAAIADLMAAAEGFEGYLGASVFRTGSDYRIVFKFDHLSKLQQWEASAIRRKLVTQVECFTQGKATFQVLTGLETWFTLAPQQAMILPPRYKMRLVTCLAAFPTGNLVSLRIQPWLQGLPGLLRSLVSTVLMLGLMTYVIMPRVTKLFAGWLYPKPL
jgi:uncharacterized protein